ncbi:MAG: hypothetical protein E7307_11500 [Butyrivibrio sp.]|nr:hypothetical protein [Butyrivibrio sp.]
MANDRDEFIKAGKEILDSVTIAIDKNDYSHLGADISKVIKSVSVAPRTTYSSARQAQTMNGTARQVGRPKPVFIPFLQKKVSRYLGVPEMFFGGAMGVFFIMALLGALVSGSVAGAIAMGVVSALCVAAFFNGLRKYRLSSKYYQYGNILKEAQYFSISDLAKVVLKSDKEVLKDIKDMMKRGFLPRARLDRTETTCMITDEAYKMYEGAENDRIARENREREAAQVTSEANKAKQAAYAQYPQKVKDILVEGDEYVTYVRQVNDIIPDTEEMSNKLYRLEEIMNKIFMQVKRDPSSADDLHKLMTYYLPTTKKLLGAYVELDRQPEVGDNITKTKDQIDAAMDTINSAFENLLNSLFQDMAWDISSDISVMKTMMAQDGLTQEGQGFASAAAAAATQTQPK